MIYKAHELLAKLRCLTLVGQTDCSGCDHMCSSNCRRVGCNCDCGEWHNENDKELEWVGTGKQWRQSELESESILRDHYEDVDWQYGLLANKLKY